MKIKKKHKQENKQINILLSRNHLNSQQGGAWQHEIKLDDTVKISEDRQESGLKAFLADWAIKRKSK
jgi:hypothetical protein